MRENGVKRIGFSSTGSIYGVWNKNGDMIKSTNMRMMLSDIKHYGLEGFEPYSDQAAPWYNCSPSSCSPSRPSTPPRARPRSR